MKPEEVFEGMAAGIIIVVMIFVLATILSPQVADIMDSILAQLVAGIVYVGVVLIFITMFYQILKSM